MEKLLKENGDKMPEADKKDLEQAITEGKEALSSLDKDRIEKALETINAKSHKLAEHLYKQKPARPGWRAPAPAPGGEKKKDDDVIDAEVVS